MRPLKFNREPDEAMTIDMTPLVDCIFAIILFLLVTSSFVEAIEQDLSIELPKQSKAVKTVSPPTRPIVVNVRYMPGGKAFYHVENEPMSLSALTVNLSRARVRNRDQAVVIRGDRNVKWEHVAAVMSCCAQVGISKVSATVEVQENK
jgi:biopolymer transport protein ExbD